MKILATHIIQTKVPGGLIHPPGTCRIDYLLLRVTFEDLDFFAGVRFALDFGLAFAAAFGFFSATVLCLSAICAAARRAIGTRNGEQDT
jgi:hypothetical protein